VRTLEDGGSNRINNLLGLCRGCHTLIHPDAIDNPGGLQDAPHFPCRGAEEPVAVIKKHEIDGYHTDFAAVEARTSPQDVPDAAHSTAVYALTPEFVAAFETEPGEPMTASLDAGRDTLEAVIHGYGLVPSNEDYDARTLTIDTPCQGLLARYTAFTPSVSIDLTRSAELATDSECPRETVCEAEDGSTRTYRYPEALEAATVDVVDSDGSVTRETVEFSDGACEQTVRCPVSRPSSAWSYAASVARLFRLPAIGTRVYLLVKTLLLIALGLGASGLKIVGVFYIAVGMLALLSHIVLYPFSISVPVEIWRTILWITGGGFAVAVADAIFEFASGDED